MRAELLATTVGLAVAFGISPYATIAVLGLAHHIGWIGVLPRPLDLAPNPWVLTIALLLTIVEFSATLIPGLASAWEAMHVVIRSPAAALLAGAMVWERGPSVVLPLAVLAGVVTFGTSFTKLGARLAIDTSPEPVSNGAANVGELCFVALIAIFVWRRPEIVAGVAVVAVATTALFVRAVWGMIWKTVVRARRPGVGSLRS